MGFIKSAAVILILSYALTCMYVFLVDHGVGVHHNNVHPGKCRIVPGITCGSEQIVVTTDGLAFITNGLKLVTSCNPLFTKGRVYLFDFNNPGNNVTELKIISEIIDPSTFDPHGMDMIENLEQGTISIYVVNHAYKTESIEVFLL